MKRIIAFALFALMIYAGGFCLVYGFNGLKTENARPISLDTITSYQIRSGQMVEGTVCQQVAFLGTDFIQPEFLGISYGEPIERRFYLVPLKYEKKAENLKYFAVCVSNPESIKQMENLSTMFPEPELENGLEFYGVAQEMTPGMKRIIYDVLSTRTGLVGVDGFLRNPMAEYYYNRIIPWTFYEHTNKESGWQAVVVGAVLCLGGVIPSVILIVRIYREKHWY